MTVNRRQITDEELNRLIELHDKNAGTFKKVRVRQSCWDSGIKIVKNCDCVAKQPYDIMFYPLAHAKIKKLQDMFPSLEWLAYLDGEIDHTLKKVMIKDLVIPEQIVTSVNVFNVEYDWNEGRSIVGVIHSHHNMGAFFSGTDDEYINQNHDVSIVVSTRQGAEIKGQVRVKTDCDSYYINENAKFSVFFEGVLNSELFEKEVESKISDKVPVIEYSFQDLYSGNFQINWDDIDEYQNMDENTLRVRLLKYYSEEEVNELIENNEAAEELMVMEQLVTLDIDEQDTDDDDLEDLKLQLQKLDDVNNLN